MELAELDGEDLKAALNEALDLVGHMEQAYGEANPQTRRQWNQALFMRFDVDTEDIIEAPLREEFARLLDPELPTRLQAEQATDGQVGQAVALSGAGSKENLLAEGEGFEPSSEA